MAEALNIISSRELDSETVQFFTHLGDLNLGILIIGRSDLVQNESFCGCSKSFC